MKRKSIVAILFVTLLLLPVLMFTSCDQDKVEKPHEHTFAAEWTSNETHHWHAATCEHTAEVKDKAEHVVEAWSTITEPTETTEGLEKGACTVCGEEVERTIPSLSARHIHIKDVSVLSKEYDGENGLSIEVSNVEYAGDEAEVTFLHKAKDQGDEAFNETPPVNAGEYTLRVHVGAAGAFAEGYIDVDYTIGKKVLKSIEITKVYDQSKSIGKQLGEEDGIVPSDDIKVEVEMKNANVNNNEVVSFALVGEDKDNYSLEKENLAVSIMPKEVDILEYSVAKELRTIKLQGPRYIQLGKRNGVLGEEKLAIWLKNSNSKLADNDSGYIIGNDYGLSGDNASNYKLNQNSESFINKLKISTALSNENAFSGASERSVNGVLHHTIGSMKEGDSFKLKIEGTNGKDKVIVNCCNERGYHFYVDYDIETSLATFTAAYSGTYDIFVYADSNDGLKASVAE